MIPKHGFSSRGEGHVEWFIGQRRKYCYTPEKLDMRQRHGDTAFRISEEHINMVQRPKAIYLSFKFEGSFHKAGIFRASRCFARRSSSQRWSP